VRDQYTQKITILFKVWALSWCDERNMRVWLLGGGAIGFVWLFRILTVVNWLFMSVGSCLSFYNLGIGIYCFNPAVKCVLVKVSSTDKNSFIILDGWPIWTPTLGWCLICWRLDQLKVASWYRKQRVPSLYDMVMYCCGWQGLAIVKTCECFGFLSHIWNPQTLDIDVEPDKL